MLELIGFGERLAGARLVITGEGSLDEQTLHGKAPAGVARAVAAAGLARTAAGERQLTAQKLHPLAPQPVQAPPPGCRWSRSPAGARSPPPSCAARASTPPTPIADIEPDLERCLAEAGPLLEEVSRRLAGDWLPVTRQPPAGDRAAGRRGRPAMRYDLVLRSRRVVLPGRVEAAAVCVRQQKIEAVTGYDARLDAAAEEDLGDLALLPGLVDTHVHVNEPGRTHWEGFETATRAAAAAASPRSATCR